MSASLVGSEMCIRDRFSRLVDGGLCTHEALREWVRNDGALSEDPELLTRAQLGRLLSGLERHLYEAIGQAVRRTPALPRTPLSEQVAWHEDGEIPREGAAWTTRDDLLYRCEYFLWRAAHSRARTSPTVRAGTALGALAWLAPATVFQHRMVPLLTAALVDVEPFRAWSVALQRRGCTRPDQLPALVA
eukprot:15278244-Alexandrium_andersonii.AAC.1